MSKYFDDLKVNGNLHLCESCIRYLKNDEMPPLCWKNSLNYGPIPDCLKLTNIEKQFIVKSLLFIKVRKLPVTRMDAMNDRVINVAVEDDDFSPQALFFFHPSQVGVYRQLPIHPRVLDYTPAPANG